MKKTITLFAMMILSAGAFAAATNVHVKIDTFPQAGNPGHYVDEMAKYYMTFTNNSDLVQTRCYRLSLCIDGYKCTKPFNECININPHSSRMIGKEMHYSRTIDITGTYALRASVKIDGQEYSQTDFFSIYGGF